MILEECRFKLWVVSLSIVFTSTVHQNPTCKSWTSFHQQLIMKLLALFDTATMYVSKCATAFLRFSPHLAVIAPRAPPQQERPVNYRDKAFINSYEPFLLLMEYALQFECDFKNSLTPLCHFWERLHCCMCNRVSKFFQI